MKVIIAESCDDFSIIISDGNSEKRFRFHQEDDKTGLVELFEYLGFNAEYEEVY